MDNAINQLNQSIFRRLTLLVTNINQLIKLKILID